MRTSDKTKCIIELALERFDMIISDEKQSIKLKESGYPPLQILLYLPVIQSMFGAYLRKILDGTPVDYDDLLEKIVKSNLDRVCNNSLMQSTAKKFARKTKGNYCDFCGISEAIHKQQGNGRLMRCMGCKCVWYCSKQSQRDHWKSGHKQNCKLLTTKPANNASQ